MPTEELKSVTQEIAETLGEKDDGPLSQLEMLVEHKGEEFVREVLKETLEVEKKGGMRTHSGKRRRTVGGVFFYLAKGKLEPELRQKIFPNFGTTKRGTVISWDERHEMAAAAREKPGRARVITCMVQGRIEDVEIKESSVVLTLLYTHEDSATYPRGVPVPPSDDMALTVYMGIGHWESVAGSLEHKRDEIIINGTMGFDPETESIAIFAQQVTTRYQERKKRQAEREAEAKAEKSQKQPAAQKPAQSDKKGGKDARNGKAAKAQPQPRQQKETPPPVAPSVEIDLPDGLPEDVVARLTQLHQAAATLRERIAAKEARGQKSTLEQKLLNNTQSQIDNLEKQYVT